MEPAAMRIPHMKPALYRAAAAGTLGDYHAALRQMRAEGAEDCQVAPNGNTVLHVAVLYGNKQFVEKILAEQKSTPNVDVSYMLYARNEKKETVLHCAAEKGDADIVSVLINAIKEYNEELESGTVGVKEMIQMTDDVKDMALHKAARMGHLEVVKLLVKEDEGFQYPINDVGETPIYLAAESPFFYCWKEILERCQNLTYIGPFGRNALHAAILSGSAPSMWENLIQNFERHVCKAGSACEYLIDAFLKKDYRLALPGIPGSAAPSLCEKLMQIFGRQVGKAECVQLLLKKEISLCEMTDNLGWTPLHYAVKLGDDETVQKILETKSSAAYIRAGIDNDDWTTIFHIATRYGNIKTMKYISNRFPDCWTMINCKSQNVLHEAILSHRTDMITYVLNDPQINNLVDQKDTDGNTPLHLFGISKIISFNKAHIVTRLKQKHLVFNKRHQTPHDVRHEASQSEVYSAFKHVCGGIPQRSGRRSGPRADLLQNLETSREDTDKNIDKEINDYLRISKTMTLVATLILTISFAAGITIPGGYDSKQGYPILLQNNAFGTFVMSNTAAFVCSVLAIFSYMIMVVLMFRFSIRNDSILETLCGMNLVMTFVAIISVVAAFLSGMYAISLAAETITMSIFLFFYFVLMYFYRENAVFPTFVLPPAIYLGLLAYFGVLQHVNTISKS